MEITLKFSSEDLRNHNRDGLIALLGGSPLLAMLAPYEDRFDGAGDVDDKRPGTDGAKDETATDTGYGKVRYYGEAGDGRKRRTKEEMAEDTEIEELWKKLNGDTKLPIKTNAAGLLADLRKRLAAEGEPDEEEEDEGGFDVEDSGGETEDEIMDLDEFRSICMKAVKALGSKTVGKIMDPHKSATDVPAEERRDYADKLLEAIDD